MAKLNNIFQNPKKDFSILIGGAAGEGSRASGIVIAKIFSELGYRVYIYQDYPSLIKGGHNFSQIRVSQKEVLAPTKKINFLLALDRRTIEEHKKDLTKDGIILYNSDELTEKYQGIGIPIETITQEEKGLPIMKNSALIGALVKIMGIDWSVVEKVFQQRFHQSASVNLTIAKRGFNAVSNLFKIKKTGQKAFPLFTGNEALSLGAVAAGLDFYLSYPMTPATGILHFLSNNQKKFKIKVVQLENEIGIINAALGAAFAGARTMVGTSGGGFALMTEGISLASQSEIPIVIVESQRMSPATGVPTYNGQGDLLFTLTAGHGDIVKFVIAPGDAQEAYFWAGKILNLSWQYQTPAILLIDKLISESIFSFDQNIFGQVKYEAPFLWDKKGKYLRYQETKNGISPLAFPGEKNVVVKSNSYEHDEFGLTVEDKEKVEKMQNKRLKKFQAMRKEVEKLEAVKVYGKKTAKKAIITWGSTKGPTKEVAEKLGFKMIQPIVLEPFPEKQMKRALQGIDKITLIEMNGLSQMEKLLNCYGIKVAKKILKYDGRPFFPEEIEEKLKNF
jgi:2-oxoglutarate ferredoxin oxidoreductase subunit alpha